MNAEESNIFMNLGLMFEGEEEITTNFTDSINIKG